MINVLRLFKAFLLIVLLAPLSLDAQTFGRSNTKTNIDSLIIDLADYLPPLNLLIDTAVAKSPQIKYYAERQKMFEYEMSMNKKKWMEGVKFSANYLSGDNSLSDGALALTGYNYGVSMQIPLSTFFGQRDQAKMAQAASDGENANKELAILEIRREVEETYSRLFMLRDLIKEATDAKESSQFIYEQAEAAYVRGQVSLDELGQNADLRSKWATNYITLKTNFYDTYRQLERLVGVPFSKFNKD
jgi:outer membrane protein TolC